jgi:hypothetical protein
VLSYYRMCSLTIECVLLRYLYIRAMDIQNIKNTPEINQVQTKKTMMRDMSKYIADLQVP